MKMMATSETGRKWLADMGSERGVGVCEAKGVVRADTACTDNGVEVIMR